MQNNNIKIIKYNDVQNANNIQNIKIISSIHFY